MTNLLPGKSSYWNGMNVASHMSETVVLNVNETGNGIHIKETLSEISHKFVVQLLFLH